MQNLNNSGEIGSEVKQTNFISLLKNPENYREKFYQLFNVGSEALKVQQFEKAIKTFSKCTDMMDLGKNILKDLSPFWKLCIYGNLAFAYQGDWKMQQCNKICKKVEDELERLLNLEQNKQSTLNLTKSLIQIKFQHCAILSQLSHHQKALQMCKSTFIVLAKYIQNILDYAKSLVPQDEPRRQFGQSVQFKKKVKSFSEQILQNLSVSLNEPITENPTKNNFYYWQKNPENNEQQVKRKFASIKNAQNCKRSILGVNKATHWIDQFNIGTIMHMSEFKVSNFEKPLPIQEYVFKDKLFETVIYCSVAHFTIATEMRFIESSKDKDKADDTKPSNNSQVLEPNVSSIIKKYGYEEKTSTFKLSQLYHIKAINIMAMNIKTTVPYIAHLIKSYDKHYIHKKQLEPVIAIDEQSLISIYTVPKNKEEQEQNFEQSYFLPREEQYEEKNGFQENNSEKQEHKQIHEERMKTVGLQTERDPTEFDNCFDKPKLIPKYLSPQSRIKSTSSLSQIKKSLGKPKVKGKVDQDNGKIKSKPTKTKKKKEQVSNIHKKKNEHYDGEMRINHQSSTQIKVIFKKKK